MKKIKLIAYQVIDAIDQDTKVEEMDIEPNPATLDKDVKDFTDKVITKARIGLWKNTTAFSMRGNLGENNIINYNLSITVDNKTCGDYSKLLKYDTFEDLEARIDNKTEMLQVELLKDISAAILQNNTFKETGYAPK